VWCECLGPFKLLLLLLWFLLLLFVTVALIQVYQAVSTLAVLVESVKMLQPPVSMKLVLLPHALLRVELLSVRS